MSPPRRERIAPPLLPKNGMRTFWLTVAVAIISFLAALDIMGASATVRTLRDWPARLTGSLTLAATGRGLESADAAAARAVEILSSDPRVASAWVLEPAPGDAVAAAMVGAASTDRDASTPRLVGVAAKPGAAIGARDVRDLMNSAGVGAAVDDHGLWSGPLERAALLGGVGAGALLLALFTATLMLTSGAVRSAFTHGEPRVSLLFRLGATDAMIVEPFRTRIANAALLGAILGTVAVVVLGATLVWSPEVAIWFAARRIPAPAIERWDLAATLIWPLAVLLAAPLAAGAEANAAVRSLT
jgi:cell division protein FtsX